MAQSKKRGKRGNYGKRPFLVALLLFILAAVYIGYTQGEDGLLTWLGVNVRGGVEDDIGLEEGSTFRITYLDVGQADCSILQCDGQTMLIDAGNNADAKTVLAALEKLGVEKLDYVVATHSHEDHVGCMDEVLLAVPADYVMYYKEDSKTKTYQNFLNAVKENGAEYMEPELKKEFSFGSAKVLVIAPAEEVCTDPNNSSVALIVTYGKTKFLFTGDAEEKSEKAMLDLGISLDVDVLQAGHHGSSTANSEAFLKAADPAYAIISCGLDNKYGHPHSEVLARFIDMDMMVYRTDTMGTITLTSDGRYISIATEKGENNDAKAKTGGQ